ncbi:hypothetical protein DRJ04_02940 [Candidatus Aerophobetes bacterium]|uniref:Uncharacterized protein n=1 Tax=Aerophobetes bacterium TaxID=2030807 RepID=A0A662DJS2_UNCAE|nr:MAG: hypothetical protein DRJ04_02940 [Candidatus Aerophobetes bacterium]
MNLESSYKTMFFSARTDPLIKQFQRKLHQFGGNHPSPNILYPAPTSYITALFLYVNQSGPVSRKFSLMDFRNGNVTMNRFRGKNSET